MRFVAILSCAMMMASSASAFCGFYVAREDGALFNQGSTVVLARDGRQTTITMSSDYTGPASEFALIVPTPRVLEEQDIRAVEPADVQHLDDFTAPRLVEYFDYDPCYAEDDGVGAFATEIIEPPVVIVEAEEPRFTPRDLGVRVEAEYAISVYDIAILSARQSDGLITYLRQEGYQIPDGAEEALAGYIDMRMKFFVARVNLERHAAEETQELQPLQISFRSGQLMLPLQLGKINSTGTQDLTILTLAQEGRIEPTNYPNALIPSNFEIPTFVEQDFARFYRDMYAHLIPANTVVTEYAWDMTWCDPCAADMLSNDQLRSLGATWVRDGAGPADVFVTRMHAQYAPGDFAQDIMFQVTEDRENFQGRYVMRIPFLGDVSCEAGQRYVREVHARLEQQASNLISHTGWAEADVISRLRASVPRHFH